MSLEMLIHVIVGTLAVGAGVTAFLASKGGPVHRLAGRVFLGAMLATGLGGALRALAIPQAITAIAGLFVAYLVLTAFTTVRSRERRSGVLDGSGALVAGGLAITAAVFGLEAQASAEGLKDGFGAEPYFFFAGLAGLCALLDLSVVLRRGLVGAQRIARHLWRMGFSLHIAVGSLFTGPGSSGFPEPLRGSPFLAAPELLVLAAMIGWLGYTLVSKRFRAV